MKAARFLAPTRTSAGASRLAGTPCAGLAPALAMAALAFLLPAHPVTLQAQQPPSSAQRPSDSPTPSSVARPGIAGERASDSSQSDQAPDYPMIRRQVELFETLIDKALNQRFERPFGILQETKGTYLEGYGAVFTVEVNLFPMRWMSPFSPPYTEKEVREARNRKLERMREAEALVKDLLREHGPALDFLRPDERVAVVVHLFNTGEHRDLPSQLIVQARRQALLDAVGQKLSAAEFRQKLTVVTF